jgi:hypothetical protein
MTNVSSIGIKLTPEGGATAQGVANPADLLLEGCGTATPQAGPERASGGTPAKPGFLRSKKCAQMRFCQSILYLFILFKQNCYHYSFSSFFLYSLSYLSFFHLSPIRYRLWQTEHPLMAALRAQSP